MPNSELTPIEQLSEINRKLTLIATAANDILIAHISTQKTYQAAETITGLTNDIMENNTFNLYKYLDEKCRD